MAPITPAGRVVDFKLSYSPLEVERTLHEAPLGKQFHAHLLDANSGQKDQDLLFYVTVQNNWVQLKLPTKAASQEMSEMIDVFKTCRSSHFAPHVQNSPGTAPVASGHRTRRMDWGTKGRPEHAVGLDGFRSGIRSVPSEGGVFVPKVFAHHIKG